MPRDTELCCAAGQLLSHTPALPGGERGSPKRKYVPTKGQFHYFLDSASRERGLAGGRVRIRKVRTWERESRLFILGCPENRGQPGAFPGVPGIRLTAFLVGLRPAPDRAGRRTSESTNRGLIYPSPVTGGVQGIHATSSRPLWPCPLRRQSRQHVAGASLHLPFSASVDIFAGRVS